ncbi:O-glucosyltransferase rumi homolog isoform X2 [Euwallacea fornicatus]|uniref:O-glucosyltransferase rumi homolog isoform X2 n=1 Tax=Euwallacea fornicatus TaxID=995702 RepID=UPI00338E94D2
MQIIYSNSQLLVCFIYNTLLIIHSLHATTLNESVQNEDPNCSREKLNKYTKANVKYKKYLNLIQDAKHVYKPCNTNHCNCHAPVISQDFRMFKEKGISESLIQNVKTKGTKYQIVDHKLYREPNCMFPSRCNGVEHFLLESISEMPDMEFIVNTRDWPQIHKNYGFSGPVFSFSKTPEYNDIMYPAWAFWEGGPAISLYPRGIGRWDIHREKLGSLGNKTKWEDKQVKGFFRGSRTCSERDALVLLSRENPELVDAQYTKNQAWKSDADTLQAPPAPEVSFEAHCQYKYLFNFRGVAASFRFKHILLCKSVVFHVGDEWQEFFYAALKPWIHYIPVSAKASKEEIQDLLEFAMNYDDVVKEIAENGYNLIWNHLKMKDVSCYWRKLLRKYASLLTYKPVRDENLIQITG